MQINRSSNRPAVTDNSSQNRVGQGSSSAMHSRRLSPKQGKKIVISSLVILVLMLAGVLLWQRLNDQVMGNRYQAVFLSNGQVYFGKLHDYYTNRPYLTDVYYFQANTQTSSGQSSGGSQLLVKLGDEIHAPEGKLILNKDAILFVENLTDKGKVVEAIKKEGQSGTVNATGGISR